MPPLPDPVIVIPGITATELDDTYPLRPETIHSALLHNDMERLTLHTEDLRYEREEPARVEPRRVFDIAYGEMIRELRPEMRQTVPVFAFGYDWRQPLAGVIDKLADFVAEVIDRTMLLPHYYAAQYGRPGRPAKVSLIGHSMGGLILTGYLQKLGAAARVGKVATIATPFGGSYEAVLKIVTGKSSMDQGGAKPREREAARLTPALYYLLPRFKNAFLDAQDAEKSFFDPSAWQPSVLKTITEYIKAYGLGAGDPAERARTLFRTLLDPAEKFLKQLDTFTLARAGLEAKDWLCLIGIGEKTRVKMKAVFTEDGGVDHYDLNTNERMNLWKKGAPPDKGVLTGDGTVPYRGARCPFLTCEHYVCLTSREFGYWEVKDRILDGITEMHGIMPNMNLLQRLLVLHLTGEGSKYGEARGWPAPDIPQGVAWDPPIAGLHDLSH